LSLTVQFEQESHREIAKGRYAYATRTSFGVSGGSLGKLQPCGKEVDFELMPPDVLEAHVRQKTLTRPFRIRTWLCRQGYIISAWALWEYYSSTACERLTTHVNGRRNLSLVNYVAKSLAANNIPFDHHDWFSGANALRNLIAHFSGRVVGSRARDLYEDARRALPDLQIYVDDYVIIEHEHVAEVQCKIGDFIRDLPQPG
jgi:hypothetical protein